VTASTAGLIMMSSLIAPLDASDDPYGVVHHLVLFTVRVKSLLWRTFEGHRPVRGIAQNVALRLRRAPTGVSLNPHSVDDAAVRVGSSV